MTSEGYHRLQDELKRLKSTDRPAIIRAIAEARDHGDLSENAEYHAARERQGFIEGRVMELEDKIARAEIIDVSKLSGTAVKFGATVSLTDRRPTRADLPDRRPGRGRYHAGTPVGDLTARPRADRQEDRRERRGDDAARRQILRGGQGPLQARQRLSAPDNHGRYVSRARAEAKAAPSHGIAVREVLLSAAAMGCRHARQSCVRTASRAPPRAAILAPMSQVPRS